eukprot:Ihof_evm2s932 gene=Ihof_evmTU2s932
MISGASFANTGACRPGLERPPGHPNAFCRKPVGTLSGFAFLDTNDNDRKDPGEKGIPGIVITIENEAGRKVAVRTNRNGRYTIRRLRRAPYKLNVRDDTIPLGVTLDNEDDVTLRITPFIKTRYDFCFKPVIVNTSSASTVGPTTNSISVTPTQRGSSASVVSTSSVETTTSTTTVAPTVTIAAASTLYNPSQIGPSVVYLDGNNNQIYDDNDTPIPNVDVTLLNKRGEIVATTTTNVNGTYVFPNLAPGIYTVKVDTTTVPAGYISIRRGAQYTTVLGEGQTFTNGNFCFEKLPTATIGPAPDLVPGTYTVRLNVTTIPANTTPQREKFTVTLKPGQTFAGAQASFCLKPRPKSEICGTITKDGAPLGNVTVILTDSTGKEIAIIKTDASGNYVFPKVNAGTYTVTVDKSTLPAGVVSADGSDGKATVTVKWANTTPQREQFIVTLQPGQTFAGAQASFCLKPRPKSEICGTITKDDAPLGNVTVILTDSTGKEIAITKTDASGDYVFPKVNAGTYTVTVEKSTLPAGIVSADGSDGKATVTVKWDEIAEIDFKYKTDSASIGPNTVFIDNNGNDKFDGGDKVLSGVTVNLLDSDGNIVATTKTDDNGKYGFTNITPGLYTVKVDLATVPKGIKPLRKDGKFTVVLAAGEHFTNGDFCFVVSVGTIRAYVFEDSNKNTIRDDNDIVLPNVVVNLVDSDNKDVATTKTDEKGLYIFTMVNPGTYIVRVDTTTVPSGLVPASGKPEAEVTVVSKKTTTDADIVFIKESVPPGKIEGRVWHDDYPGDAFEYGDYGLMNVKVTLYDSTGTAIISTTTTDMRGFYKFLDVAPGKYIVKVDTPRGHTAGKNDNVVGVDGQASVTVTSGETVKDIEFAYIIDY